MRQAQLHKYPAEFTNIVVINITSYVYLYLFASFSQKTPTKLYSQRQLLLNNNYNSFCVFIVCVCLVLSKTPVQTNSRYNKYNLYC